MSGKTRNADCLILILIGVLLSFVYNMAASSPYNETGVFHGLNYNLVVYAGTLAASFLLFVILTFIVRRLQASPAWAEFSDPESRSSAVSRRVVYVIYIAVIISVLILVYQIYINENNLYPENTAATFLRQMVPHPLYFGIIVYLSAILLVSLRTRERFADVFKDVDGMIVSGFEHVLKPDPAIYHLLLDRYCLKAEECVFIDDRDVNIEAARAVGMKGIVYTGPEALK